MAGDGQDHINVIERKLIDCLRTGDYDTLTGDGTGSAWASGNGVDVTVYGQFPTTEEINYPCIIVEEVANGTEEQFMGRKLTYGSSDTLALGALYGVGFNVHIAVDRDSTITVDEEPYKERRLINYLMLNCANILSDCTFDAATTEVVERHYSGFREMGYNPQLEVWAAICSVVMIFKNTR